MTQGKIRHVVIVGGGFGGLNAARALAGAPVRVTLIDRRNYHLFQPLLYQVATAGLSPADIAAPIRHVLGKQANAEVLLGEVNAVDRARKIVRVAIKQGSEGPPDQEIREVDYDDLVIAAGSRHSYFGHDEWENVAPGLKTIRDATRIRRRILLAFERAETEPDPRKRAAELTFVIVGGGATGVEMAGSIAELAHRGLRRDFRRIEPGHARILLMDAGPRILAAFPEDLAKKAADYLRKRGVEIMTGARVEKVDFEGVEVSGSRIASRTVLWAAGVAASPAGKWLGAETDKAGRVKVRPDLSVPGLPDVFVIGDAMTLVQDGHPLPGVAPVAMQQGNYVGRLLAGRARGKTDPPKPFHYFNKGNLATVGRSFAVAEFGRLKLSGFVAWLTWLVVHIFYLIGFRTKLIVLIEWAWAYLTYDRGARLITGGGD
jgi:NADH dehydrogenase